MVYGRHNDSATEGGLHLSHIFVPTSLSSSSNYVDEILLTESDWMRIRFNWFCRKKNASESKTKSLIEVDLIESDESATFFEVVQKNDRFAKRQERNNFLRILLPKKRRLVNHVGEKNLNGYFFRSKMFSAKNESTSIQNFFSLVAICSHGSKGGHSCYIFVVLWLLSQRHSTENCF